MEDLKAFYTSVIRSTLEYCSAHIWHGNLTNEQTRDIECIQKRALRIMLPELPYLKTLEGRREDMCINLILSRCLTLVINCMNCCHLKFVKLGIERQD
jgi:hypothetical protein